MDLGATKQCVLFGCKVFWKNYSELLKLLWPLCCWQYKKCNNRFYRIKVDFFFLKKILQNKVFFLLNKKVLWQKRYLEVFFWKSGIYKSKYTPTPFLNQNMVHFTLHNLMKPKGKHILVTFGRNSEPPCQLSERVLLAANMSYFNIK